MATVFGTKLPSSGWLPTIESCRGTGYAPSKTRKTTVVSPAGVDAPGGGVGCKRNLLVGGDRPQHRAIRTAGPQLVVEQHGAGASCLPQADHLADVLVVIPRR